MSSRWADYPPSEQARTQAASVAMLRTHASSVGSHIKDYISAFSGQELVADDANKILCYYRTMVPLNGQNHLTFLCNMELGCCYDGCCSLQDPTEPASYGWAIALVVLLAIVTLLALGGFLVFFLINRDRDKRHRLELASTAYDSATGSQISGPTYYGNAEYYPYMGSSFVWKT
uniref:CX domain-containing protein n=1 Tax=Plectus sambesii TaxID=2011161 RepID=A0A914XNA7_9BILA